METLKPERKFVLLIVALTLFVARGLFPELASILDDEAMTNLTHLALLWLGGESGRQIATAIKGK